MAPSAFEAPHIIPPTTIHTHTVIALHGRGYQGLKFATDLFEETTSSKITLQEAFPSMRWVFPSSQERYSTVFDEQLDEWFDIYSLSDPNKREELQIEGLHDSITFLHKVIDDEATVVPADHVILLGLSQGCAVGLLTLLSHHQKLGAYIGLNGWLPLNTHIAQCHTEQDLADLFEERLDLEIPSSAGRALGQGTPVLLCHTTDDEVIDVELGRRARDVLGGLGMDFRWEEMGEGGHLGMLKSGGLDVVVEFLRERLGVRSAS